MSLWVDGRMDGWMGRQVDRSMNGQVCGWRMGGQWFRGEGKGWGHSQEGWAGEGFLGGRPEHVLRLRRGQSVG